MERRGDWIQAFPAHQFWSLDPRFDEVHIESIAHSLAMQCRYAGHCLRFYSVAEHCVLLSRQVEPRHALWALLHDASEAYLVDVPRPVKGGLLGYHGIEHRVMEAVVRRFKLRPLQIPIEVHEADMRITTDEKRQNMAPGLVWGTDELEPLGVTLRFWSPEQAEQQFLERFSELINQREAA